MNGFVMQTRMEFKRKDIHARREFVFLKFIFLKNHNMVLFYACNLVGFTMVQDKILATCRLGYHWSLEPYLQQSIQITKGFEIDLK